jgi:hypothetical protein
MSQQINLFNPIFLKQDKHFSLLTMIKLSGLILLGSIAIYAYASYQVIQLRHQSEESTQNFNAEEARLKVMQAEYSPQQAGVQLQSELAQLEKRARDATELVDTLRSGAVGNTTGYSEYLRAFSRQVVPGLWLTGFKLTGDAAQISLRGGAVNPELVPVYIQKLGNESVMQGKTFATLQIQQPKADAKSDAKGTPAHYVEFTLHSTPDNEAQP